MAKGTISVPIAVVGSIIIAISAGLAAYYGTVNAQDNKISTVKEELKNNISDDRQRISTLEEAINTIKASQVDTRTDIKEILRIIK